ncbi:unnamed protein product [Brassica rapa]|uniref:Uncharacterized protein n=1 Tax=Brassica campestris TaxID=3711 RepID=A0A8D9G6U2_BRACM|nr:unnamed protein product [Brassica rapa]
MVDQITLGRVSLRREIKLLVKEVLFDFCPTVYLFVVDVDRLLAMLTRPLAHVEWKGDVFFCFLHDPIQLSRLLLITS